MNRTIRDLLVSTSLGLTVAAVQPAISGDAYALDSSTCMPEVQLLRHEAAASKGGETIIAAPANAAEVACLAGDYGQASAYIADAQRRLALREAQRDITGAADEDATVGGVGVADLNREPGPSIGDDDGALDNAVGDADDDVDNSLDDVADDIGDAFDGGLDDNDVHLPARSDVLGGRTF